MSHFLDKQYSHEDHDVNREATLPGYAEFDPDTFEHPRYATLELADLGLHAGGILYAFKHRTDGFIPERYATKYQQGTKALVDAGIWARCEHGFRIVNFAEHTRSGGWSEHLSDSAIESEVSK